jgi:predicted nucleic acid-binding protein
VAAKRGSPAALRGVLAFDHPGWTAPKRVVVDTSVVVEAIVPNTPTHDACAELFQALSDAGTTIVYNGLLTTELAETLFRLALLDRWGRKQWRRARYDGRARRRAGRLLSAGLGAWQDILDSVNSSRVGHDEVSDDVYELMRRYGLGSYDTVHAATALKEGIPDIATLDQGFAALPPSAARIHTTYRRLPQMRNVRGQPPTPPEA